MNSAPSTQLRLAFDRDAVLFSDETDCVFQECGLQGAVQHEKALEAVPIGELGLLREKFSQDESPVRTYLVTVHSEGDMSLRALNTLRAWGLHLDKTFFMDGAPKGPTLAQIRPHVFFDDSPEQHPGGSGLRGPLRPGAPWLLRGLRRALSATVSPLNLSLSTSASVSVSFFLQSHCPSPCLRAGPHSQDRESMAFPGWDCEEGLSQRAALTLLCCVYRKSPQGEPRTMGWNRHRTYHPSKPWV
uniref:Cytosolic 5'-nucleotidase 1A-like n=1 Tax=Phascolarctos cinereus TaxID=38626 RepID=A0A6P5IZK7_PHACI|nr:cytosolic 5'-nucleotidase 1A-like [Phascolarctos cinereus]